MDEPDGRDPVELSLIAWLERTIGGTVTAITRQNRWRAAWFVDLTRPSGLERLYVRGDRAEAVLYSLEHEYRVLKVLEAKGLPVPRLYGLCPDPRAIVMAAAPGRASLATAASDEERRAVMDHYIELLAAMHAIDPAEFEAAGLVRPTGAITGVLFEGFLATYRKAKQRPEPMLEFFIRWVARRRPRQCDRLALICADSGQFMFQDGRVTALLDFELAHLGDPVLDLAALQLRDTSEPFGDLGAALRRYAEITGEAIDAEAFDFHTIQWSIGTPLQLADSLTRPVRSRDLVTVWWYIHMARMILEAMARFAGIELPPKPVAERSSTRFGRIGERLSEDIGELWTPDGFPTYERDAAAAMATYLQRKSEMGPVFDRQDMTEVQSLLGAEFADWQAADAALETFVTTAGPEMDAVLIPLFYRRIQRQQAVFLGDEIRPEPCLRSFADLTRDGA
jgi:aminoglycoside phosphotransferase (APT) family kinase protein